MKLSLAKPHPPQLPFNRCSHVITRTHHLHALTTPSFIAHNDHYGTASASTPRSDTTQDSSSSTTTAAAPATTPTPTTNKTDQQAKPYPPPLTTPRPPPLSWNDGIILLQGFGWESSKFQGGGHWYSLLSSFIPHMTSLGITHLWLPPPSHSVSKEGYLPTQLYDLSSAYGDPPSLLNLTRSLLQKNIRPVADIVINHRCADEQNEHGVWNKFRDDIPHPGRPIDWGSWAITGDDPDFEGRGHADSGADYGPSPDLDHENEEVRLGIVDWLRWLVEYIGCEGWRLDFARGYSAEAAGWYIKNSLPRPGEDFSVAEYWVDAAWAGSFLLYDQDHMRQGLCDWIEASGQVCAAFDFPTKALLQEAIRHTQYDRLRDAKGKPPGLLGWWPARAVTFIENHDTGSSQRHWPFPESGVLQGYAYILTHPGIPCIFWEHFADDTARPVIATLTDIRQRAGITAESSCEILAAESDMYVAKTRGGKKGAVVVKLGPRYEMPEALVPQEKHGYVFGGSGKDWAVWYRDN